MEHRTPTLMLTAAVQILMPQEERVPPKLVLQAQYSPFIS